MTKQDRSVTLKLQKRPGMAHFGSLMVHAEETVASKQAVELILRCTHLENKDTFSKSVCFELCISSIFLTGFDTSVLF